MLGQISSSMYHMLPNFDQADQLFTASTHIHEFSKHKNIAYRFLSPGKIAAAVDMSVTADPCVFTRLFLIFRGIPEDDMAIFSGAGEKEANLQNWREVVGWTENSKDTQLFRVLETTVLEIT
jgi:hypothetical protein